MLPEHNDDDIGRVIARAIIYSKCMEVLDDPKADKDTKQEANRRLGRLDIKPITYGF
jgi:hypothetical protein